MFIETEVPSGARPETLFREDPDSGTKGNGKELMKHQHGLIAKICLFRNQVVKGRNKLCRCTVETYSQEA